MILLETLYFQLGDVSTLGDVQLGQIAAYFYVANDLVDIINLSDKSYTVQYQISESASDKAVNIYVCGLNKVNQKTFAKLQTTLFDLIAATRSKRTLTLQLSQSGDAESLEDCLKNKDGIQINSICTNDSAAALAALPRQVAKDSQLNS